MQKPWGFHPAQAETESPRHRQTRKEVGPIWDVPQKRVKGGCCFYSLNVPSSTPSITTFPKAKLKNVVSILIPNASFTKLDRLRCPCPPHYRLLGSAVHPTANGVMPRKSITAPRAEMGHQPGPLVFWLCMRNPCTEANLFSFSKPIETKSLCYLREFCPLLRSKMWGTSLKHYSCWPHILESGALFYYAPSQHTIAPCNMVPMVHIASHVSFCTSHPCILKQLGIEPELSKFLSFLKSAS